MGAIISHAGANTYSLNVDREKMAEKLGKAQNIDTNLQKLADRSVQGSVKEYQPPSGFYATNGRDSVELSGQGIYYSLFVDPWNKPEYVVQCEAGFKQRMAEREKVLEERYAETGEIPETNMDELDLYMNSIANQKGWLERQITDILGEAGIDAQNLGGLPLDLVRGDPGYDNYLTFKVAEGHDTIDSAIIVSIEKALNNPEHQSVAYIFDNCLASIDGVDQIVQRYAKYHPDQPALKGYEDFDAVAWKTFF